MISSNFARIHTSIIVNLLHVNHVVNNRSNVLKLKDGEELSIAADYKAKILGKMVKL